MGNLLCRKEVLLLVPMIFQSSFSTYNATYFTVRARALASLVANTGAIFVNFSLGFFLDWRRPSVNMSVFVVCIIPSWLVIREVGVLNGLKVHSSARMRLQKIL
jgi:hypothetical protein